MNKESPREKTSGSNTGRPETVRGHVTASGGTLVVFDWEDLYWLTPRWLRHWDFIFKDLGADMCSAEPETDGGTDR